MSLPLKAIDAGGAAVSALSPTALYSPTGVPPILAEKIFWDRSRVIRSASADSLSLGITLPPGKEKPGSQLLWQC